MLLTALFISKIEEGEQKEGDDDVPFDFTGAIKDSDDDDDDTDVGTQPDRYKDLPEFSDSDDDDDEIGTFFVHTFLLELDLAAL